jgi:hypothetical protein
MRQGWGRRLRGAVVNGLSAALIFLGAAGAGNSLAGGPGGDAASAPPAVVAFLGRETADIVAATYRIEPFELFPALSADAGGGPDAIAGYRWKTRGAPLGPAEVEAFKGLVLAAESYVFDVAKKCAFVPDHAFRFLGGGGSVVVLVSFRCDMWAFRHGDRQVVEDFDPVRDRLKAIVGTVFRGN